MGLVQVELGGYVGYSAILFADAVRAAGGTQYFCLEHNAEFASIIRRLCELAGLDDLVTVVVGDSAASLRRLKTQGLFTQIDLLFLDHYKPLYLRDLKLCEELGFVKPGTTLVADNVIKPGNPPYLAYVRATVEEKMKNFASPDETRSTGLETGETQGEKDPSGNPALIYESSLVKSFEPTGVPVSQPPLPPFLPVPSPFFLLPYFHMSCPHTTLMHSGQGESCSLTRQ